MSTDHRQEAEAAASAGNYEIAQYHASMLQAEQQRIANLIALARLEAEGGGTDRATFHSVFDMSGEGFLSDAYTVRPAIREGLGLA